MGALSAGDAWRWDAGGSCFCLDLLTPGVWRGCGSGSGPRSWPRPLTGPLTPSLRRENRTSAQHKTLEAKNTLRLWKKAYFDTRAKIEASGREARWEFDRKRLFEKTDYMSSICQDLYDVLQVCVGRVLSTAPGCDRVRTCRRESSVSSRRCTEAGAERPERGAHRTF